MHEWNEIRHTGNINMSLPNLTKVFKLQHNTQHQAAKFNQSLKTVFVFVIPNHIGKLMHGWDSNTNTYACMYVNSNKKNSQPMWIFFFSEGMDPMSDMGNIRSFNHNAELQEPDKPSKTGFFGPLRQIYCLISTKIGTTVFKTCPLLKKE